MHLEGHVDLAGRYIVKPRFAPTTSNILEREPQKRFTHTGNNELDIKVLPVLPLQIQGNGSAYIEISSVISNNVDNLKAVPLSR